MRLHARRISPGRAEGTVLLSRGPVSFLGGVDPDSGTVRDDATGIAGESLRGRVFVFPTGKGSTVGSYVLYGLAKRGLAPAALVNERAETIVAVGAILGGVPMVDGADPESFLPSDRAVVDADRGAIDLPDVAERPVVTAFLRNRGRILFVRRSEAVGSFRGRWSAISGYIEGSEDPAGRARQEIREETQARGARLRRTGSPVVARDGATAYVVHPFLFDVPSRRIALDWENVEARWLSPAELEGLDTVPRLRQVLESVLHPKELGKG